SGANGAWSVVDVTPPGANANVWYVSCAENGNPAGQCGSSCGTSSSLHVGNVASSPAAFLFCPTGDCGAAYDASDGTCAADKRAISPIIDASGKNGISAQFNFLGEGDPCNASTDLEYSADGGPSWAVLSAC